MNVIQSFKNTSKYKKLDYLCEHFPELQKYIGHAFSKRLYMYTN